jgi:hypothetical protein
VLSPLARAQERGIVSEPVADIPVDNTSLVDSSATAVIEKSPVDSEGVSLSLERDQLRLDLVAFQSLSVDEVGEYTQIGKNERFIDGDDMGFNASAPEILKGNEEVHVYDAPCGRGWQLIIHDTAQGYVTSSTTGKTILGSYPITRSYGYGCEHDIRTSNW